MQVVIPKLPEMATGGGAPVLNVISSSTSISSLSSSANKLQAKNN